MDFPGWRCWMLPKRVCVIPVVVAAGCAVAYLSRRFVSVSVSGNSMQPAYSHGDRVIVRRGVRPSRGDIVVIERPDRWGVPVPAPGEAHFTTPYSEEAPLAVRGVWPGEPVSAGFDRRITAQNWMIKRVLAMPGDPVPVGRVPILSSLPGDRVPAGKVVVVGDNASVSFDSRQVGYFPLGRVLGTVAGRRKRPAHMEDGSAPATSAVPGHGD
ncbi:S26 family signal peptidase [Streptomyces decoyicus]|uniref:S26 family signal peptidase n=1 Tax=Streptomyces decoyicus TaxID=249567 RepID=UPI003643929E